MTSPGADSNLCYYSPVTQMQMRMQMRSTGLSLVKVSNIGIGTFLRSSCSTEDEENPVSRFS